MITQGERNDDSFRHADGLAMIAANIGGAALPILLPMASCTWRAGWSRTMPCHPDPVPGSGRRAEGRDAASEFHEERRTVGRLPCEHSHDVPMALRHRHRLEQDGARLQRHVGRVHERSTAGLGIGQDDASRLERRNDTLVSALRMAVKTMGGGLRLVAELPNGRRVEPSG